MAVEVRLVSTPQEFKAFFDFPWTIYKDDPNWVPPLLSMRHDLLDKKKNPAWQYMEGDYFAAWRGEKIVGTIVAFINHRHNEFHKEHVGWFGMFECFDDPEAAQALLNTATEWVRSRGYDAICGPQTFTTHEDVGLLIDGFVRPVLLMAYHPRYYRPLIENAGFVKTMDVYSFHLSREDALNKFHTGDRLERLTNAVMKRNKITIRPIDKANKKRDFALFREIYNSAWDANWGFVPMTEAELDALVESLGIFLDWDLALFAYVDDKPAGFIMAIPDFNEILKAANPRPGVPEFISLIRAVWYWKIRRIITWARVPLMGVKPEFRKLGVDAAMYHHALQAILKKGYITDSDSGWILEVNDMMVSIAKSFGAEIYKTHRLYEKRFK